MNKFILSVEDDEAVQCLLELAFRELGPDFHLYKVTSGEEALKFLGRDPPFADAPNPDLILSDLNMPGMNGIELLTQLRAEDNFHNIPVIIISSSRLAADRAKCLAVGAKQFITKPSNYNDLVAALKTACASIDGLIAGHSI